MVIFHCYVNSPEAIHRYRGADAVPHFSCDRLLAVWHHGMTEDHRRPFTQGPASWCISANLSKQSTMIIHQVINHDTSSWKRVRITPVTTTRMCCVRLQQPSRHPLRPCVCVTQLFPILELQYINQLCMCVCAVLLLLCIHAPAHTLNQKHHCELLVWSASVVHKQSNKIDRFALKE